MPPGGFLECLKVGESSRRKWISDYHAIQLDRYKRFDGKAEIH
jgi:hypothetical protein